MSPLKKTEAPAPAAKRGTAARPATEPVKKSNLMEVAYPPGTDFGGGPPEGTYLIRCTAEPAEMTDNDGNVQTVIKAEIIDPDYSELEGMSGQYRCSREQNLGWKLSSALDAFGVDYEIRQGKKGSTMVFDPADCVGAVAKGVWAKSNKAKNDPNARAWLNRIIPAETVVEEMEGAGGAEETTEE